MKAAKPKRPAQGTTLAYARLVDTDGRILGYRLFRRSSVNRRTFPRFVPASGQCRRQLARDLWQARMVLRSVVDHYDLIKLGLTP